MPGSRGLARFNRRFTNVFTSRFAPWAPGFGIVTHRGRRSGQLYRTPVNVFPRGDKFIFALTYGPGADWVKNVLAAGEADLHFIRRDVHLINPRVLPAGSDSDGLPWLAKRQIGRVGIFVADIA
jgi:deazaflavin-dependent oxidoreductase (nitroreductase family)